MQTGTGNTDRIHTCRLELQTEMDTGRAELIKAEQNRYGQSRTDTGRAEPIRAEQNRYGQTGTADWNGYRQSRTDTVRPEVIHAEQNRYMQRRTDTCRPEAIHAGWNRSVHHIRLLRFFYGIPWVHGYGDNGYGYEEQFPCQFFCFWVRLDRVTHGVDGYGTNGYSCR